jgi:hypothetical protein
MNRLAALLLILLSTAFSLTAQSIYYRMHDRGADSTQSPSEGDILDSFGVFERPARLFVEGAHLTSRDGRFSVGDAGLWSTCPVYNFVDGFWLGQTLNAKAHLSERHKFELEAMVYYTTARKAITWQTDLTYLYRPEFVGKLKLSAGDASTDYDTEEHLARLENSLYSLFLGHNYMKLYRRRFVELKNSFYPFPGFRLYHTLSLQKRSMEVNRTHYSFIKPSAGYDQSNIPDNRLFRPMPDNVSLTGSFGFDFTFEEHEKHRRRRNNEIIYSYIPTLSTRAVFGVPTSNPNGSRFLFVEGSVNQRFKFCDHNTLDYHIGGGGFLLSDNVWFVDFRHFGAYTLPSMRTFSDDGYFLIGYYKADTDRCWAKSSANYMSEHFLLTQLKPFGKGRWSEGVHFRYLWTPVVRHYTEYGYSFGFRDYVRIGAFVGFTGIDYTNFGVTVSFPWLTGGY